MVRWERESKVPALDNPKYERFCQEYLIDLNGTQACIRAGYSKKTADVQASQILGILRVQDRIAELQLERSKRTEITQDAVLNGLWSIAQDDIRNYLSFKQIAITSTCPITNLPQVEHKVDVAIKDSDTIDTRNISEVSIGKDGQFKFKLYCRDSALVNVGKHLGMFKEKLDLTLTPEIDTNKLSTEDKLLYLKLVAKSKG